MGIKRSNITAYKVMAYAEEPGREIAIVVNCYDGSTTVATLNFYHEIRGKQLPASEIRASRPNLSYPLASYPTIIDILRNESPVHVLFNDTTGLGYIGTEQEATGEGEK